MGLCTNLWISKHATLTNKRVTRISATSELMLVFEINKISLFVCHKYWFILINTPIHTLEQFHINRQNNRVVGKWTELSSKALLHTCVSVHTLNKINWLIPWSKSWTFRQGSKWQGRKKHTQQNEENNVSKPKCVLFKTTQNLNKEYFLFGSDTTLWLIFHAWANNSWIKDITQNGKGRRQVT